MTVCKGDARLHKHTFIYKADYVKQTYRLTQNLKMGGGGMNGLFIT